MYRLCRKFYPFSLCILSAKYGFLFPDNTVPGPYNVSFNDIKTNPITLKKLSSQVVEKGSDNFEKIVILGSKNYANSAKKVLSEKDTHTPLKGYKRIGYIMGKLTDAINRGVSL